MAKKNILAEAMADAKQLKEAALENAKATMQEHFTPKLKSMVDAALREEMEEDLDEKYGAEEESEKDFEDGSKPDKVKSRWGKESDKKPLNEKDIVAKQMAEIEEIKNQLNEANLINAKLLYFGKVVKENDSLSKTQKVSFLKQLDRASTPKEAKLIYTTINESLKVKSVKTKNKIKEGFASKAAGTSTKNKQATNILEDNQVRNRFMQLAGLLKENK